MILEVLVFIYLMAFRPVQSEVVRDGYLDDFRLLVYLVPNDINNVWFNGPLLQHSTYLPGRMGLSWKIDITPVSVID